jgi:DnaJ-class molecular chaperone
MSRCPSLFVLVFEWKTYRILLDRFHPDKNVDNPDSAELFKEIAYSYEVLSDPAKRHQYDISGFEVLLPILIT